MCESCNAEFSEESAEVRSSGAMSRRTLLAGAGFGIVGAAVLGIPGITPTADAATLKNAHWCNPALGYFPNGGYYGAPRDGGAHAGQDITNSTGTAIYAAAGGTVIRRQWGGGLTGRTGYGIVISHGSGYYTYYGHLSVYRVSLNQSVSVGQRIADMGATGNVTGPHLHFETHYSYLGKTTNPVTFLSARGVDLGGGWSTIDPGASGATVKVIQHLLNQRGYGLYVDGSFGSVTTNAVKRFQSSKGLYADGQVGPKTWPYLDYSLQQGHSGHHVRGLQVALNKHSAGIAVDGDFGSVTNSAVRSYQSANRLVVDGVAGSITWRALVG